MASVVYERECAGGDCDDCDCPVMIFGYFQDSENAEEFCLANEGFIHEPIEFLDDDEPIP